MELQNKFKELFLDGGTIWEDTQNKIEYLDYFPVKQMAKDCTILCLEEQIKLLNNINEYIYSENTTNDLPYTLKEIEYNIIKLQQELKLLKK